MTPGCGGTRSSVGPLRLGDGVDAMATEDGPDTRWGKPDTHRGQLTLDPPISPGRVLTRKSKDNLHGAGGKAWSTGAVGIGPPAPDEVPMPAQQRLGLDEEPSLVPTAEEPTQPGKQRPVAGPQSRTGHLAAEHRYFVSEHDDFDRQVSVVTPDEPEQLEYSDERQVEERQRHDSVSSSLRFDESPAKGLRMTFSAPTGRHGGTGRPVVVQRTERRTRGWRTGRRPSFRHHVAGPPEPGATRRT